MPRKYAYTGQTTQLISCLLANIKTTDRTGKLFAMFCSVGKIHKDTASKWSTYRELQNKYTSPMPRAFSNGMQPPPAWQFALAGLLNNLRNISKNPRHSYDLKTDHILIQVSPWASLEHAHSMTPTYKTQRISYGHPGPRKTCFLDVGSLMGNRCFDSTSRTYTMSGRWFNMLTY